MHDALDKLSIDMLRFLAVDMVEKADSGHPGLPLGSAPMAYALWTRHLKHDPAHPLWPDRDRFVLSAGHGSALLYGLLHLSGYPLAIADLQQFRQRDSKAPGHPERGRTAGVEVTTGPLGQGFANAVGMAIAEAHLAARYNRAGHVVVDHRTWALASDGDLMEGIASEAASLAGHLKLGKLGVLYDDNAVTLSAGTEATFTEDRAARFRAYGWQTIDVADGNDLEALDAAFAAAKAETARPTLILVRTHLGFGSPLQDDFHAHGSPLGAENVRKTKEKLGWPAEPAFLLPPVALAHWRTALDRGESAVAAWNARIEAYAAAFPELARELQARLRGELPDGWDREIPIFPADDKGMATRTAGGKVMNAIAAALPALFGGSADLDPSTRTALKELGDFQPPADEGSAHAAGIGDTSSTPSAASTPSGASGGTPSGTNDAAGAAPPLAPYAGRNLHVGVREHAMGGIVNGLAAHGGFIPYGSTFLIFSDYMRPSIRLAALMGLHLVHVYTHDSLGVGEDGPTHQPVEQLASLRAIPQLTLIRPADANETAVAWKVAIETRDRPVLLVLSRQDLPTLDRTQHASAEGLRRGAYVLREPAGGKPAELLLIASGSEVALILAAAARLEADGMAVRCVSMPSWALFDAQPAAWRDAVLPPTLGARLAVELGVAQGWHAYVGAHGDVVSVERFGASAPSKVLLEHYGFSVANVVARARALLDRAATG